MLDGIPAALKKLTEALALAEPGGFIRLFGDPESLMADLLARHSFSDDR